MPGTLAVVIPTYNEERNIARMAKAIREAYPEFRILFMDDNSTDRSRELIEGLDDPLTKICVREREERGLAASVMQGFALADTDYAVCMDCDFQHPIATLEDIYDQLEAGADLCVGARTSRMAMGLVRTSGSMAFELFCKIALRIHGRQTTKDLMSGLFGLRCDVFRPIIEKNWDDMELQGWKVLVDLLKHCDRRLDVRYAYYKFEARAEGESHLSNKVPIMTLHQLWGFGRFCSKILCKVYRVDYYEMYPKERKHGD